MDFKIRAGMRVLYKQGNSNWLVGDIMEGKANVTERGVELPIWPHNVLDASIQYVELNNIFFDAFKLEDWYRDYPQYFMHKSDYIDFINSDEFDKRLEYAFVSDGEYGYYPINKFNKNWLEKQPFDYVVRGEA